jgi:hypothetical protein
MGEQYKELDWRRREKGISSVSDFRNLMKSFPEFSILPYCSGSKKGIQNNPVDRMEYFTTFCHNCMCEDFSPVG